MWQAIEGVCLDYDRRDTHFSPEDAKKWATCRERMERGESVGPKPTRRPMSVSWLRPLKGLAKADYVQLCQWASHVEGATQQRVYFHGLGTRGGPSRGSMAHHAMGAK